MKNAILEDLLRLGKEAGLKSFEQVIVAMFEYCYTCFFVTAVIEDGG